MNFMQFACVVCVDHTLKGGRVGICGCFEWWGRKHEEKLTFQFLSDFSSGGIEVIVFFIFTPTEKERKEQEREVGVLRFYNMGSGERVAGHGKKL